MGVSLPTDLRVDAAWMDGEDARHAAQRRPCVPRTHHARFKWGRGEGGERQCLTRGQHALAEGRGGGGGELDVADGCRSETSLRQLCVLC